MLRSLDWWWKIIWEFITSGCELGFHNDTIDIFKVGHLFQRIILCIILKQFVKWISHQQCVFKLWQLS